MFGSDKPHPEPPTGMKFVSYMTMLARGGEPVYAMSLYPIDAEVDEFGTNQTPPKRKRGETPKPPDMWGTGRATFTLRQASTFTGQRKIKERLLRNIARDEATRREEARVLADLNEDDLRRQQR